MKLIAYGSHRIASADKLFIGGFGSIILHLGQGGVNFRAMQVEGIGRSHDVS